MEDSGLKRGAAGGGYPYGRILSNCLAVLQRGVGD